MGLPTKHVLALAGGVGGAKLVLGMSRLLAPEQLTVVVNTGDDEHFHGLHVSPDLDTVAYALAGIADPVQGWGLRGETFRTLAALERLGSSETWFLLGDVDLATHLRRTQMLREGLSLSQATSELSAAMGIRHSIVPMTDDRVRTVVVTEEGELPFQDYFVRRRCEPPIRGIRFDGAADARPTTRFAHALASASAIIFCPSNPVVSIAPILAIPGVRDSIASFHGPRIAVSPIVGGQAVKGPAAKMMAELGEEVSPVGVARRLSGLCGIFVMDRTDQALKPEIDSLGMHGVVASTMMRTDEDKVELAGQILALAEEPFATA